jgi:hypothetical protein
MAIKGLLFVGLRRHEHGCTVQCTENIKIRIEAQVINTTCGFRMETIVRERGGNPAAESIFLVAGNPRIR